MRPSTLLKDGSLKPGGWLYITIVAVYLILATAGVCSLAPWCDEGWFSDPAWNLMTHHAMANSSLDPTATWRDVNLTGINRHAYWIMPLYVVAEVAWFKLTGFGLIQLRLLSTIFGLLLLFAWYRIALELTDDRLLAVCSLAFLAVDFNVIFAASAGRMDMMTVALGSLGVAAYLHQREVSYPRALLLSNGLTAAALMTHPNGVFFVADVCFLALWLDRTRLFRLRSLLCFVLPYTVAFAGWGLYIAKAPNLFVAQFIGNIGGSGGRLLVLTHPVQALRNEIVDRYLASFGASSVSTGASRIKLFILFAYVTSAIALFASRMLRSRTGYRLLAGLFVIHTAMLALTDGFKQSFYMIYVEPLWVAALAAFVVHCWRVMPNRRHILAVITASLLCVQVIVTAGRFWKNPYMNRFMPAAEFVQNLRGTGRSVMASSEMAFRLGFTPTLIDDYRLGYRSGKRADIVVLDEARYQPWIGLMATQDPPNYWFIQHLLASEYRLVYDQAGYRVYERIPRLQ